MNPSRSRFVKVPALRIGRARPFFPNRSLFVSLSLQMKAAKGVRYPEIVENRVSGEV